MKLKEQLRGKLSKLTRSAKEAYALVREDVQAVKERDPAAQSSFIISDVINSG